MRSLIIDTHESLTKIYPIKFFIRDCVQENISKTIGEASDILVKRIEKEKSIIHSFKSFNLNKRGAEYTIQFLQDLDIINKNNLLTAKGIVFKHFIKSSIEEIHFDCKEKYVFFKYYLKSNFAFILSCMRYIHENQSFSLDTEFINSQDSMKLIEEAAKIALKLSENRDERDHAIRIINFLQKNRNFDSTTNSYYSGYSYKTRVHKILPIFSLLSEIGIISSYKDDNKIISSDYTDTFLEYFSSERSFQIAYKEKTIDKYITLILFGNKNQIDESILWEETLNSFNLIKDPQRNTCYLETLIDIIIVNLLFRKNSQYTVTYKIIYDFLREKSRNDKRMQILPDRWGRPSYFYYR